MPKQPKNWPDGVLPRRLTREWAAFYTGVSPTTFDAKVAAGLFPHPDQDGKYDLKLLDLAIDKLNGIGEAQDGDDWSVPPRRRRGKASRDAATE